MISRVIARAGLSGLRKNSGVYHVLAAAADEDAEQYFQLARLRDVFSIDNATGSDLDERAAEIETDEDLTRIGATKATTTVLFSRPTTVGTVAVPIGSVVTASDSAGTIRFETTAAGSILAGNTVSAPIPVRAVEAGTRGNVSAGAIARMETRIAGITGVTNEQDVNNAFSRESDPDYRARIKGAVQRMSRGTVFSIESYARAAKLDDGARARFVKVVEPIATTGNYATYIDDGTGSLDVYSSDFITADDTLIASAAGGEYRLRTNRRPIRDDGSFVLRINGVVATRGAAYLINPSTGDVELTVPLTASQNVKANYRNYVGLVQEVQKVLDGDANDRQNYPGVRAGGRYLTVLPASRALQSVTGIIDVLSDYDLASVIAACTTAIQEYINGLDIGEPVLVSRIIEAVTSIEGVYDFTLQNLSGSSPAANQITLPYQVARILSNAITLV